jgi:hypothetical protein
MVKTDKDKSRLIFSAFTVFFPYYTCIFLFYALFMHAGYIGPAYAIQLVQISNYIISLFTFTSLTDRIMCWEIFLLTQHAEAA